MIINHMIFTKLKQIKELMLLYNFFGTGYSDYVKLYLNYLSSRQWEFICSQLLCDKWEVNEYKINKVAIFDN